MFKSLLKHRVFVVVFLVCVCFLGGCLLYFSEVVGDSSAPRYPASVSGVGAAWFEQVLAAPGRRYMGFFPPGVPKGKPGMTWHADLLAKNPVEALRAQTLEKGHWSARWIPPFPPENVRAQMHALAQYLANYYVDDSPEGNRAAGSSIALKDDVFFNKKAELDPEYRETAHYGDLLKLTWTNLSFVMETYGKLGRINWASDYFPREQSELNPSDHPWHFLTE